MKNKAALLLVVLFVATRLGGIQSRPIWYDEAFSVLLSERGPEAILSGTLAADADSSAAEEHPPAYYFLLWGWIQLFGSSLAAVRLLSVILSLGTIAFLYGIAHHLFDGQTALVAAILAALLPFQIHYAVEIRMYGLLAFWLTLATLTMLKRQWILFSLAAALAQYTHNLAAFYLIPLALTPIFQRDWKTFRNLTLAGLGSIVLYIPWLIQLPSQLSKVTSSFWIEKPGVEKLFTLFLMYLPHLPLPNFLLMAGLLVATLVIALAAFQTYRARSGSGAWLAYLAFTPPLLLWLVSQVYPLYVERALLPSHVIFCLWLAWAFTQTKLPRPIQGFAFALILAAAGMGIYQHVTYRGFPYMPPALTESLAERFEEGDVVIHSSKLSYLPALVYDRALPQGFIADPANSSVDTLSPATQKILNLNSFADIESGTGNAVRVWFIIYQQSLDEYADVNQVHPHIEYLDEHFTLESTEEWDGLKIYLYQ